MAWDQSPIPDSTRTPRIPGNDRVWFSAGVGYRFNRNWSWIAFYTHVFVERADINLATVAGRRADRPRTTPPWTSWASS